MILKTKTDLKDLITEIVILGLGFLFIDWLSFGEEEGGLFEIGRRRSRWWKNIGPRWARGMRGLENSTIFMHVICSSSLKLFAKH